ncbi:hypothetical protein, partial [Sandaracinomonas limnophila]
LRSTNQDTTLVGRLDREISRATQSEALKELLANKATGITDATNNDTNYPTVKAIKGYVDGAVSVLSTSDSTSAWITRERNRAIS